MTTQTVKIRQDQLAAKLGAQLLGDPAVEICGINTIQDAAPGEICFLSSKKHAAKLANSRAAAVLTQAAMADCPMAQFVVGNVDKALIAAMTIFAPKLTSQKGIHPSAVVEPDAQVDPTAFIGPGAYIGHHVIIGARTVIGPNSSVGENTANRRRLPPGCKCGGVSQLQNRKLLYYFGQFNDWLDRFRILLY